MIAEVRRLKEREGGELQVHGSWQLAHSLHLAGLVDEYRLLTFPVCVGAGKRLFTEDGPATGFRVVESRATGSGVTYLALTPSEFVTASIAVQDGKEVVLD